MLLSKSPRFVAEYTELSDKIAKITDENKRSELTELLKKMAYEVKAIDTDHQELVFSPKLPADTSEKRQQLSSIRKKLFDKIKDCERAGLIR
jgi:predicted nuclease with TOPRIM domain